MEEEEEEEKVGSEVTKVRGFEIIDKYISFIGKQRFFRFSS